MDDGKRNLPPDEITSRRTKYNIGHRISLEADPVLIRLEGERRFIVFYGIKGA
jgi:hypothetical protein